MIKFINALTGTEMFVADDRKEEYLAAGHKLAAGLDAKKTASVQEEPKKAPVRKSATKKK